MTKRTKKPTPDNTIRTEDGRVVKQTPGSIGILRGWDTLYLRIDTGEAIAEDGTRYELTLSANNNVPIVHNDKTGLWFTLSWQEIIKLAIQAGIDGNMKEIS